MINLTITRKNLLLLLILLPVLILYSQNRDYPSNYNDRILIVLDTDSLRLKQVYQFGAFSLIHDSYKYMSENELRSRAEGFIKSVDPFSRVPVGFDSTGYLIHFKFDKIAKCNEFMFFIEYPNDFGNTLLYDRYTGQLIYAAFTTWRGKGYQIFPFEKHKIDTVKIIDGEANPPDSIFICADVYYKSDIEFLGMDTLLKMNVVQSYSKYPYNILVFIIELTTGALDRNNTDWVVLLYRKYPENKE